MMLRKSSHNMSCSHLFIVYLAILPPNSPTSFGNNFQFFANLTDCTIQTLKLNNKHNNTCVVYPTGCQQMNSLQCTVNDNTTNAEGNLLWPPNY